MRTTTIGGGSQIAGWRRDNFCTPHFPRRGVRPDLEHRPTVSSNVFAGPGAIAVGESDNWFSVVARLPLPGDGSLLPEKRLMLAVLNDALLTLAGIAVQRTTGPRSAFPRATSGSHPTTSNGLSRSSTFATRCTWTRRASALDWKMHVDRCSGFPPAAEWTRWARGVPPVPSPVQCGATSTQPQVSQRRSYDEVCLVLDDEERKRQLDGLASVHRGSASFRRGREAPCRQHKPRTRGSFVGRSFVQTIICEEEKDGQYHDAR